MSADNYDRISMTAYFVAYWRQFSDIPFAGDVAELIHANEAIEGFLERHDIAPRDISWYAPLFELRYKSILELLRRSGVRQILELAGGLSFRGLYMAQDPAITYVDTDLEALTQEKSAIIAALRQRLELADHHNYLLATANVFDQAQLKEAVRRFDPGQPLAIVTEGLLPYFTEAEIAAVAANFAAILRRHDCLWITPDFSLQDKDRETTPQRARVRAAIAELTGRLLHSQEFADEQALAAFLAGFQLRVQAHKQVDLVGAVTSMPRLGLDTPRMHDALQRARLWAITAAAS